MHRFGISSSRQSTRRRQLPGMRRLRIRIFRMQSRPPLRILRLMSLQLLPEFRILQSCLKPRHEATSPSPRHSQPSLNFGIRHRVLRFRLRRLPGKVRHSRRQRILKRLRHLLHKSRAKPRIAGQPLASPPRKKLPSFPCSRFAQVPVRANISEHSRPRFNINVTLAATAVKNQVAISSGRSKQGALVTISPRVNIRLPLQPTAQQYQLRPSTVAPRFFPGHMPQDIDAARRTQRHNPPAGKFQLRKSPITRLDNVPLSQAHPFARLIQRRTTNYPQRSFEQSDRAHVLRSGRNRQQPGDQKRNAQEFHVDPETGELREHRINNQRQSAYLIAAQREVKAVSVEHPVGAAVYYRPDVALSFRL